MDIVSLRKAKKRDKRKEKGVGDIKDEGKVSCKER